MIRIKLPAGSFFRMRRKPPRARADRTRGEILPQLTTTCQVPKTRNHNFFTIFPNSRNLHNWAIEQTFGPHRSSYAAPLYGHLLQNQPIRRTWPEPAYTGSLHGTSSIRPLPLELAGARTPRTQLYTKIFARNGHFQIKKVRYEI